MYFAIPIGKVGCLMHIVMKQKLHLFRIQSDTGVYALIAARYFRLVCVQKQSSLLASSALDCNSDVHTAQNSYITGKTGENMKPLP